MALMFDLRLRVTATFERVCLFRGPDLTILYYRSDKNAAAVAADRDGNNGSTNGDPIFLVRRPRVRSFPEILLIVESLPRPRPRPSSERSCFCRRRA